MKLLIALLAVLAGAWLWRRGRRLDGAPQSARQGGSKPLPMVCCARCGMHVPGHEAVAGRHGSYCCAGHRRQAEGA